MWLFLVSVFGGRTLEEWTMTENEQQGFNEGAKIGAVIVLVFFAALYLFLGSPKRPEDTETYTDYRVRKAMEATKNVPVAGHPLR